jgi:type 1 fimbria pilin
LSDTGVENFVIRPNQYSSEWDTSDSNNITPGTFDTPLSEITADGVYAFNINTRVAVSFSACNATAPATVILPPAASDILMSGATSTTNFALDLRCATGTRVNVALDGPSDNHLTGELRNNGTAGGVTVQLLNGDSGQPFPLGPPQYFGTTGGASDAYSVPLVARLHRTGPITPGSIATYVNYTVTYD